MAKKQRFVPSAAAGYARVKAERDAAVQDVKLVTEQCNSLHLDLIKANRKHRDATQHIRELVLERRRNAEETGKATGLLQYAQAANDELFASNEDLRKRCTNANALRLTAETETSKVRHQNKKLSNTISAQEFEARHLRRVSNVRWWTNAFLTLAIVALIVGMIS